ncbi:hypothetical protein BDV59DRAFT_194494 [Aspergillus ambiguus]|uniref:uncharacterized protein n=1 Tax=Aspergillus ambiguus TaxID=176160 RepID=UPI003CCE365C
MTKPPIEEEKYEISPRNQNHASDIDYKPKQGASEQMTRPKCRIRRSMTACQTCRKLKTRCDLDPRGHACRRCISLRIDCQLPDTTDRPLDSASIWSDTTTTNSSIEERLSSLESSMKDMTEMLRQLLEQTPTLSDASIPQLTRSNATDDTISVEGIVNPLWGVLPKPAHIVHELQTDIFGEPEYLPLETPCGGNVIDPKLSSKLMQIFLGHFGPWVSIYNVSDVYNETKQPESLLYYTSCLLASRYMPGVASPVVQAMYFQIRQKMAGDILGRLPLKFEVLQAITLLCLWPTNSVQNGSPMDSWVLSGIAIDHALVSFQFLENPPYEHIVDNDIVPRLRLWNSLCLARIQSAIANARPFHIPQRYLSHCFHLLEHPAATYEDRKVVAEIQLYLITLQLQRNYRRMRFPCIEYEEIERWKLDWAHLFNGEENSTIELNLWFCQILLHQTAMKYQLEAEHLSLEITQLSRLIVSKVLQARLSTALGFTDHVYIIIGYAALNLCHANTLDPLIEDVQMYLLRLSPNERHITYRYSCMIADFKQRCSESQPSSADLQKIGHEHMQVAAPFVSSIGDRFPLWNQIIPNFKAQPFQDGFLNGSIIMADANPTAYRSVAM